MFPEIIAPRALRAPIDAFVGNIVNDYASLLRALSQPLLDLLLRMDALLRGSPWWRVSLVVAVLACRPGRGTAVPLVVSGLMFTLGLLRLWDASMQTVPIMIVEVILSALTGVPIGILMASFKGVRSIMLP